MSAHPITAAEPVEPEPGHFDRLEAYIAQERDAIIAMRRGQAEREGRVFDLDAPGVRDEIELAAVESADDAGYFNPPL